ncbi:cystathionine gamma-lyase [Xylona heveae TC161]|uniref:cystathionine gamma-lyase n=1 Tax=Xylona heveae (strain CBS 132557 / TC161) TaxID=1328760 RepID=A0A165HJM8_XYLHT|nr:cystathionine gamma-lyase [Xylona heveae TC161]KZF23612.1 cystathionine gamma-lyase [Xylona heveae TC161]
MDQSRSKSPSFATRAVHTGLPRDVSTGALSEPIYLTTTFTQDQIGVPKGPYVYSRSANPNRESFERAIADLEASKYAVAYASGIAATAAVLQTLAANSHIISIAGLYGGTHRYLSHLAPAYGISVSYTDNIEAEVEQLIILQNDRNNSNSNSNNSKPKTTSLVWIETPSNPLLRLVDIEAVASVAHRHGCLVVVDNTFLSPYIQNPLKHGADIVLHSVTKYINGHSDVLMGALALNSDDLKRKLSFYQNAAGGVPSPFDCWLAHRGLKTLHLRAHAASANAKILASALESSPRVVAVHYPGLDSHSQRQVAIKQHREGLGGGMISFRIKGGREAAETFCTQTRLFALAESLGGVESLCEVPASMTHTGMPRADREAAGIYDDLIRISVGIEGAEDLLDDLKQALAVAVPEKEY